MKNQITLEYSVFDLQFHDNNEYMVILLIDESIEICWRKNNVFVLVLQWFRSKLSHKKYALIAGLLFDFGFPLTQFYKLVFLH